MANCLNQVETESICWRWQNWSQLTTSELESFMRLRQMVFVVEQNCPYLDTDGLDPQAIHFSGWQNHELVAYCRYFPQHPEQPALASLGRVCTASFVRGEGVGRQLMQQVLTWADNQYPGRAIKISAQQYLTDFYQTLGFEICSEPYLEDDIPHIGMLRTAAS